MSFSKVITIWLAFGLMLGLLVGLRLFIASSHEILPTLAGISFGLLIGLIGGIMRAFYLKRR